MLTIEIPGYDRLALEHLALDLNGTLALDGEVLPGVAERLAALSPHLQIHLLTADTRGRGAATAAFLDINLHRLAPGDEAAQKRAFVLIVPDIGAALDLLLHPQRLVATLRR